MTKNTGDSFEYNSGKDFINGPDTVRTLAAAYVGGTDHPLEDPVLSPIYATADELRKIGPHWISIAGCDMLRTGGEVVAEMLKQAGVPTVVELHEGQQHVMEFMTDTCPESAGSIERIGRWIQEMVGR
jgi:acetyl esterase/lipase